MPFFRHEINTGSPQALPTGNTSQSDKYPIAKSYLDVTVNSPHPVRGIEDFSLSILLKSLQPYSGDNAGSKFAK